MTSFTEVVQEVLIALEKAGIPYMVVGSFAASVYGVSRATHDLDVVVALSNDSVAGLKEALGEGFYFDELAAAEAVERSDLFNVLHFESGLKVDFWILGSDRFSQTQFQHRKPTDAWGECGYVASPEDTILSKLVWYKMTPSDRQLSDVRDMMIVQRDSLDYEYLRQWAKDVGVEELLDKLLEEI